MWIRVPKSTAREESGKRKVRRTFKILREIWLSIGLEKIDTHEGIKVKVLLDSSAVERITSSEGKVVLEFSG